MFEGFQKYLFWMFWAFQLSFDVDIWPLSQKFGKILSGFLVTLVALVKSVYSMIPVVAIAQFLYRKLLVKIVGGHGRWREKERKRRWEKSVRDSLLPERFDLSLLNLTMGQIPSSSMMDNLLETNCANKMTIMIRQEC
jgi:hypothetical protein